MKTPQIAPLQGMAPLGLPRLATDQREIAQRKWQAGIKPAKPQQACDVGLFGDSHLQAELFSNSSNVSKGK